MPAAFCSRPLALFVHYLYCLVGVYSVTWSYRSLQLTENRENKLLQIFSRKTVLLFLNTHTSTCIIWWPTQTQEHWLTQTSFFLFFFGGGGLRGGGRLSGVGPENFSREWWLKMFCPFGPEEGVEGVPLHLIRPWKEQVSSTILFSNVLRYFLLDVHFST